MTHDWMIEVLGDLRAYARANGLPVLADCLEETLLLAAAEIASAPVRQRASAPG